MYFLFDNTPTRLVIENTWEGVFSSFTFICVSGYRREVNGSNLRGLGEVWSVGLLWRIQPLRGGSVVCSFHADSGHSRLPQTSQELMWTAREGGQKIRFRQILDNNNRVLMLKKQLLTISHAHYLSLWTKMVTSFIMKQSMKLSQCCCRINNILMWITCSPSLHPSGGIGPKLWGVYHIKPGR